MAIGGFYGLTGVNLLLSDINVIQFKELVKSLDTSTNRPILNSLKDDLEYLKDSLNSLPFQYESRDAIIASARLKGGRYEDDDEKEELENFLKTQTKILSRHFVKKDKSTIRLTDCSFDVLRVLYERRDKIDTFLKFIVIGEDNSGVSVLGQTLYRLKSRSRGYLNNVFYNKFGHYRNSEDALELLKDDVETLEEYMNDSQTPIASKDLVKKHLKVMYDLTSAMNVDYFNTLVCNNYSFEDYYNSCKELVEIGVVGFNVFTKEFYKDFCSTVSLETSGDLSIYPDTDLYDFVLELKEILYNYEKIGGVKV